MNIGELARRTGLTIRALRYYEQIGLLVPCARTEGGYRCYGEDALARLYLIRSLREVELPLRDIRRMLEDPGFSPSAALDTQIRLLTMRRARIDRLIDQAKELQAKGMTTMDFTVFDDRLQQERTAQAKAAFGDTAAWQEYEQKEHTRQPGDSERYGADLMAMLAQYGQHRAAAPDSAQAQAFVQQLKDFITEHFYTCTVPILRGLADLYESEDFTRSIDQAGGPGTAAHLAQAMRIYANSQ